MKSNFVCSQAVLAALLVLSSLLHRGYSQEHDHAAPRMISGPVDDSQLGGTTSRRAEKEESSTALRGGDYNRRKQGILDEDLLSSSHLHLEEWHQDHRHDKKVEHAAGAAGVTANALPPSGYGGLGGTKSSSSSFARQLQEATGNANDFIERYTEDILLVLGLEEPPSNRTELLILMGPFIAEIRANLAKEKPDFDQSLITDEQLVDFFFPPPPPAQSSASNSTATSPPANVPATNSTDGNSTAGSFGQDDNNGDGGRRLQDACLSSLSQVVHMSMHFYVAGTGNYFDASDADAAASKHIAGVDMATVRKYAPFRYGNLKKTDEDIKKIAAAAVVAVNDARGLSTLINEAMSVWTGIDVAFYALAGIVAAMMATGLADAELGSIGISDMDGFGFNEQYRSLNGQAYTRREWMKRLIDLFNRDCGAISSTPCWDNAWTYNGPGTYNKVCIRSWHPDCPSADCAQHQCKRSGGTWAGLDTCCNPYTCNYPLDQKYVCPTGWEPAGKGYNGLTGLKCTKAWAPDCDEGCARSQCSSKRGRWANVDPCCNPFTCYLGVKCPEYSMLFDPNYYPWSAVGPGPNGQDGLTCTGAYRSILFEQWGAENNCRAAGGEFPALDFGSNPFTCYVPEPL